MTHVYEQYVKCIIRDTLHNIFMCNMQYSMWKHGQLIYKDHLPALLFYHNNMHIYFMPSVRYIAQDKSTSFLKHETLLKHC